jgi:hypothetical protein
MLLLLLLPLFLLQCSFMLLWCWLQLEALSDRLLVSFKEASLDLGKLLATKGLAAVSGRSCSLAYPRRTQSTSVTCCS